MSEFTTTNNLQIRKVYLFFLKHNSFLGLSSVLILDKLLNCILESNEIDVLPAAKAFMDPSWIPHDWYLSQITAYRSLFEYIAGSLALILPLHIVSVIGHGVIIILFSLAITRLSKHLAIKTVFLIPFIILYIHNPSIVAREWIIFGFETKAFAYILVIFAISFLIENRLGLMLLFLGLATSFHVLVGVYATICLSLTVLFSENNKKEKIKEMLKFLPVYLAGSVFALRAVFIYLTENSNIDSVKAAMIYVLFRVPHHLYPAEWNKPYISVIVLMLMIIFFMIAWRSKDKSVRIFSMIIGFSGIFFLTGIIIFFLNNIELLKFYWFRFPDTMMPLGSYLLIAWLLSNIVNGKVRLISHNYLKKAVLFTGVILTVITTFSAAKHFQTDWYNYPVNGRLKTVNPDLNEALIWIKNHTVKNCTFLVNPVQSHFHIIAERGRIVSLKQSPQSDKYIIEWFNRLTDLNGGIKPVLTSCVLQASEISYNFHTLSAGQLNALAQKYNAWFYLTRIRNDLPFKRIFRNNLMDIYYLKGKKDNRPGNNP